MDSVVPGVIALSGMSVVDKRRCIALNPFLTCGEAMRGGVEMLWDSLWEICKQGARVQANVHCVPMTNAVTHSETDGLSMHAEQRCKFKFNPVYWKLGPSFRNT
jgi:hypothetical protein